MLFDLQSGKRKRVVQVVFGALAVMFAVSFVFLGIGTEGGGNPLEAVGIGGQDSAEEAQQEELEDAEQRVEDNPSDTAALIELINLRYQSANTKYDVDEETGQASLSPEAEEELERAADTWDLYVKRAGKEPNTSAALVAVQVFSALAQGQLQRASTTAGQPALDAADESLTNWKNAGTAQLVIADAKGGTAVERAQAAEFLYYSGDAQGGAQQAQQALAAAPGSQRKALEQRLDAAEKQGAQLTQQIEAYRKRLAKASAQGGGGGGATEDPLGDLGGGGALGGGGLGGGGLTTP